MAGFVFGPRWVCFTCISHALSSGWRREIESWMLPQVGSSGSQWSILAEHMRKERIWAPFRREQVDDRQIRWIIWRSSSKVLWMRHFHTGFDQTWPEKSPHPCELRNTSGPLRSKQSPQNLVFSWEMTHGCPFIAPPSWTPRPAPFSLQ